MIICLCLVVNLLCQFLPYHSSNNSCTRARWRYIRPFGSACQLPPPSAKSPPPHINCKNGFAVLRENGHLIFGRRGARHFSRPWGVVDPMTAQQVVGIIAEGVRHFPAFVPPRRPLDSEGMYHEEKQAQFGLRLPGSGPETPSNTVRFRNVKISASISLCLPKYGCKWLEKRGSPRPFKSRLFFLGSLPVWGEIGPTKGR